MWGARPLEFAQRRPPGLLDDLVKHLVAFSCDAQHDVLTVVFELRKE
jgi:hypothetical protein